MLVTLAPTPNRVVFSASSLVVTSVKLTAALNFCTVKLPLLVVPRVVAFQVQVPSTASFGMTKSDPTV